ncbi:MAG: hypothetical protein LBF61_07105 [Azoarcus sp.]|jgi:Ca2+-binding RTX toxin-like protein|nr:hypothetical protein [Azoarcus sp.]
MTLIIPPIIGGVVGAAGVAVGAAGFAVAGVNIAGVAAGLASGVIVGSAVSIVKALNPVHIIKTIVELPALIGCTVNTVTEALHPLPYEDPGKACETAVTTVASAIGNIAATITPGYIGETVGTVSTEIGSAIVSVCDTLTVPKSIPESIKDASTAITNAIDNCTSAIFPGIFGEYSVIGGTVHVISSTVNNLIGKTVDFVTGLVCDSPKVVQGSFLPSIIIGRGGADTLYGGGGGDCLYGEAGDDVLYGGTGGDKIYGGSDNDKIYGEDGCDKLYGGEGNDYLSAGAGEDCLYGDVGNDRLYGGAGNDKLYGGEGDDWLSGCAGDDILNGGEGSDFYIVAPGQGKDTIYDTDVEGNDIDAIVFFGLTKSDLSCKANGDDLVVAYGENDCVTIKGYFELFGEHQIEEFHFQDEDGNTTEIVAVSGLLTV